MYVCRDECLSRFRVIMEIGGGGGGGGGRGGGGAWKT